MKKIIAPILMLFLTINVFAQVKTNITRSKITFQIKNLGINTGGSISGLQASIMLDPANLSASTIEGTVDANTINTDNETRDHHLKSEDFFDVARYPKITMKSVSIKHKSGDKYVGVFNLTMKDKTKQVEVPFTYTEANGIASIKGSFKLNRTHFGVGGKSLIMSSDVIANIELDVSK